MDKPYLDSPYLFGLIVPLKKHTFKQAISTLKKQIELSLSAIEEIEQKEIGYFSIGKTYARKTVWWQISWTLKMKIRIPKKVPKAVGRCTNTPTMARMA